MSFGMCVTFSTLQGVDLCSGSLHPDSISGRAQDLVKLWVGNLTRGSCLLRELRCIKGRTACFRVPDVICDKEACRVDDEKRYLKYGTYVYGRAEY